MVPPSIAARCIGSIYRMQQICPPAPGGGGGGIVPDVMTLRPEALRGVGAGTQLAGQVDYRLARNSTITAFHKGRLSRLDICDAHPELLRAALNVGDEASEDCP